MVSGNDIILNAPSDLGSPFLTELSETGFDVNRNIGGSLSEIILKKTKIFYEIPKHLNQSG